MSDTDTPATSIEVFTDDIEITMLQHAIEHNFCLFIFAEKFITKIVPLFLIQLVLLMIFSEEKSLLNFYK